MRLTLKHIHRDCQAYEYFIRCIISFVQLTVGEYFKRNQYTPVARTTMAFVKTLTRRITLKHVTYPTQKRRNRNQTLDDWIWYESEGTSRCPELHHVHLDEPVSDLFASVFADGAFCVRSWTEVNVGVAAVNTAVGTLHQCHVWRHLTRRKRIYVRSGRKTGSFWLLTGL